VVEAHVEAAGAVADANQLEESAPCVFKLSRQYHHTGQDAVRYAHRHGGAEGAARLEGIILQAPVSDREWLSAAHPSIFSLLPKAQSLVAAGRSDEIVTRGPSDLDCAPLSAGRLVALTQRMGDDDMWSMWVCWLAGWFCSRLGYCEMFTVPPAYCPTGQLPRTCQTNLTWPVPDPTPHPPRDLTSSELSSLLGHLKPYPLLLLQSGADECVQDQTSIPELGRRVMAVAGGGGGTTQSVVIEGAPHNAGGFEDAIAKHAGKFLQAVKRT
jgi:hypothetical protein